MAGQRRTPFVGRDTEIALLRERWAQAQDGRGQVVVLSGEAGIGKSRLVQVLREQVIEEAATHLVCQCWPYQQHSPLAPLITLLQQALDVGPTATLVVRLHALEQALAPLPQPLDEVVPLFAALLSVPLPARYPALTMSPQRQKQHTLHALLTLLLHMASQKPLLLVIEDLHWVDPSTLEWLSLLVDQSPTTGIMAVCTYRPDFSPPWPGRAHLTQVTLARLPQAQTTVLTQQVGCDVGCTCHRSGTGRRACLATLYPLWRRSACHLLSQGGQRRAGLLCLCNLLRTNPEAQTRPTGIGFAFS